MKYFIYAVIGIVVAVVIAGFFFINSPAAERALRFDEQRVSDLQSLQGEIIYYWQAKQKLPASLNELVDATRGTSVPRDPETGAIYSYSAKSTLEFSLCANFSKKSEAQALSYVAPAAPYPKSGSVPNFNWSHDSGNFCFDRKIDTDFYKPIK